MNDKCKHCGSGFVRTANIQKFCSVECRKAFSPRTAAVRDVVCKGCSVKFSTTDVRKEFCTAPCRHTYMNRKRETSRTQFRDCVVCGKSFQPMQKTGPGRTWCSEACKHVMNGNPRRLERHLNGEVDIDQAEAVRQSRRDRSLKQYFGISLEQYEEMHKSQNGLCSICNEPETRRNNYDGVARRLAVDHCHTSGNIRALLCSSCNTMIGQAKDSPVILQAAIEYLKSHQEE